MLAKPEGQVDSSYWRCTAIALSIEQSSVGRDVAPDGVFVVTVSGLQIGGLCTSEISNQESCLRTESEKQLIRNFRNRTVLVKVYLRYDSCRNEAALRTLWLKMERQTWRWRTYKVPLCSLWRFPMIKWKASFITLLPGPSRNLTRSTIQLEDSNSWTSSR